MNTLVWGLVILVLFPLLQIPVLLYLARNMEPEEREESDQPPTPATSYWINPGDPQPFVDADREQSPSDSSVVRCPDCGTDNDPLYTFCRNCVTRLPPMGW
ncbi:DUF7577 domain-containing protein [Halocatena halophila]|uniref:DUF7577 domain-containing protein n=1 Tax=Halocatena halophila TaxID=2814576 RepID=UPI002ED0225E